MTTLFGAKLCTAACAQAMVEAGPASAGPQSPTADACIICMEPLRDPTKPETCSHVFCRVRCDTESDDGDAPFDSLLELPECVEFAVVPCVSCTCTDVALSCGIHLLSVAHDDSERM